MDHFDVSRTNHRGAQPDIVGERASDGEVAIVNVAGGRNFLHGNADNGIRLTQLGRPGEGVIRRNRRAFQRIRPGSPRRAIVDPLH